MFDMNDTLNNIAIRCPLCGNVSIPDEIGAKKLDEGVTVKDIFDTLDHKQKLMLYYMIGEAVKNKSC